MLRSIFDEPKGTRTADRRTICEVHRQLYDNCIVSLRGHPCQDTFSRLIEEAYVMGMKMDRKLKEYKFNMAEDCPLNPVEEVEKIRRERIRLTKESL